MDCFSSELYVWCNAHTAWNSTHVHSLYFLIVLWLYNILSSARLASLAELHIQARLSEASCEFCLA